MRWRKLLLAAAASSAALLGTSASAESILDIDVNGFKVTRTAGTFDSSFTGTLTLSFVGGKTNIASVEKNGSENIWDNSSALTSFSATMSFFGGNISGGSFAMGLANGDSYSGSFFDDNGATTNIGNLGGQFQIAAGTSGGTFVDFDNDGMFGNVDISEFLNPLYNGSLFGDIFKFDYDGELEDIDVDAEFTVVVPVPPAYGLGLAGLLGVAVLRRRRNKATA